MEETGKTEFWEDDGVAAGFAAADGIKDEEEETLSAERLKVSAIEVNLVEGIGFPEQDTKTGVSNRTSNRKQYFFNRPTSNISLNRLLW